jgi:hypothetical protein
MDVSDSITLVLSIVALAVSGFLAFRQNMLQKLTNNAPALVDLLSQFRSSAVHEGFEFVCTELDRYEPEKGLSGLPPDVRYKVYDVCYRNAGQCSALQGGGEGPRWEGRQGLSSALSWMVLLLDVLLHDAWWCAAHGAGEVRA